MSELDCNVCKNNSDLEYVSIDNTSDKNVNITIESIGHNDIYFCTDKDSTAVTTEKAVTTCLSPRDPCANPSLLVSDIQIEGRWSVELEDGTIIEDKTIEELAEILLDYDLEIILPPDLSIDCNSYYDLPSEFSLEGDFNYDYDRQWTVYINEELIGTTRESNTPSGDSYENMESLIPGETIYFADYPGYFQMENSSEEKISVVFVPNTTQGLDPELYLRISNPSLSYNPSTGVIKFCLSPYVEEDVGEITE